MDNVGRFLPQNTGVSVTYCDISAIGNVGNVTGCAGRGVPRVNQIVTGCTELSIEHPLEMNAIQTTPVLSSSIFAQTHEYKCFLNNADKLKEVTIFSGGIFSGGLVVTCIKDIAHATVDSCEAKLARLF